MGWFSILFGKEAESKEQESTSFVERQGKAIPIDDSFRAWTSGSLNEMLKAAHTKTNLIDRHFLLLSIVGELYKLRKDENHRKTFIEYADKHLAEFSEICPALKKDMGGILPQVPTFQYYATVLTEDGSYDKAISICENAIGYGLQDGTKLGFEGRIERIKKKANEIKVE